MTIQQISIFVENKAGCLEAVMSLLAKNDIDIRALSIADTPDFGILRIIVSDTDKAAKVLADGGYVARSTPVLAVEIADRPGGMAEVLGVLAKADISLEYTYAFITRHTGSAYMICRVEDNDKAAGVLAEAGIKTATREEIDQL